MNDLDAIDRVGRRGEGGHGAPDARRHAHAHRLRQPEEAGHRRRRTASRSAPRRSCATKKALGWPSPDESRSTCPRRRSRTGAKARERGAAAHAEWTKRLAAYRARVRRPTRRSSSGGIAGELPDGLGRASSRRSRRRTARREPRRVEHGAQRARRRGAGAHRRLGRPHAVERHGGEDVEELRGRATTTGGTCTSASASTAWGRS